MQIRLWRWIETISVYFGREKKISKQNPIWMKNGSPERNRKQTEKKVGDDRISIGFGSQTKAKSSRSRHKHTQCTLTLETHFIEDNEKEDLELDSIRKRKRIPIPFSLCSLIYSFFFIIFYSRCHCIHFAFNADDVVDDNDDVDEDQDQNEDGYWDDDADDYYYRFHFRIDYVLLFFHKFLDIYRDRIGTFGKSIIDFFYWIYFVFFSSPAPKSRRCDDLINFLRTQCFLSVLRRKESQNNQKDWLGPIIVSLFPSRSMLSLLIISYESITINLI